MNAIPPVAARRHDSVATLTIDRRGAGNALRGEDLGALAQALRENQSDPAVRVIVLTGAGEKFFCSGSDIAELAAGLPDIGLHLRKWHTVVNLLESSEKPVIAAINGVAVGGGLELALACQRRIAVESARVGLPELKVGLFPAAGGVRRLTRLVGAARALESVLSAALWTAEAAKTRGVIDQVVAAPEFAAAVAEEGARLAGFEPNAVRATLLCARAAALGIDSDELETSLLRECYATPRNRQVLQSFLARPRDAKASA